MSKWRDGYIDRIRRNKKTYVKQAYYNDTLLHLMMKEKLLTGDECKALLNALDPRKQPEIVVEVLAYQNEWDGER